MPFIQLKNVTKRYGTAHGRVDVLANFQLDVEAGEFLAVMGPSGCGKSTMLNLIGGLDQPDSGEVTIAGTRINRLSQSSLTRWRATTIGFVFQSHFLMPMLTAAGNVELPLLLTRLGRKERRERVAAMLARVGLSERARHKPTELSGGQQQRVGIARALIADAPLLVCDEPTAGLDRATANQILGLLSELCREGRTIVMATHDPVVAAFGTRRIEMAS